MVTNNLNAQTEQISSEVRANWGWLMFMGIALAILGCIGLYMTGMVTLVSMLYIGIMLLAGGVLMLIDAFKAEGWKAKIWAILLSIIYVISGAVMIINPTASAVWFTLFIAAFLLVSGITRIIIGIQVRKEVNSWGWTVFGGIVSIILAVMIFNQWPISGLWVVGMFVAIEMLLQGTSMISIAMAAKASK
jgi:uncharacterized membrane protein HdeD (DUF308 family)